MVDGSSTHQATVAVEHTDLMLLGAPINTHKPLIRHAMIVLLRMYGGLHDKAHRSLSSLQDSSLWGSPVVVPRPCTGARSATSYRMCTTGHSLGYKSHGGARSTGHLWYSQRGDPLRQW